MKWHPPPELVEMIRRQLAGGLSIPAVARAIGRSHGSVSGIVRRHIQGKREIWADHKPRASRVPKPKPPPKPKLVKAPKAKPAPAPVVVAKPVPLLSPFSGCRWALNNHRPWRFCEAPVRPGTAWCEGHYGRVYVRRAA